MVSTLCRDCVFAIYENNFQTGCNLNRLSKYADQKNCEIVTIEEDGKHYAKINNRYCRACRNQKWADNHVGEDLEVQVRKEMEFKYTVILRVLDHTDLEIERCIESFKSQFIPPHNIIVCSHNRDLTKLLTKFQGIQVKAILTEEGMGPEQLMRHCIITNKNDAYFMIFDASFVMWESAIAELDYSVNENLAQFSLLLPVQGINGFTIHKYLYDIFKTTNMCDLQDLIKEQGYPDMIKRIQDLCPSILF